jgi:hypothetical protein
MQVLSFGSLPCLWYYKSSLLSPGGAAGAADASSDIVGVVVQSYVLWVMFCTVCTHSSFVVVAAS